MKVIEELEAKRDAIDRELKDAHVMYGEWLRVWREEGLKESLRSLSQRLRISAPYLSDIERGNRSAPKHIRDRVSKIYNK